jgi:hypothetical protein
MEMQVQLVSLWWMLIHHSPGPPRQDLISTVATYTLLYPNSHNFFVHSLWNNAQPLHSLQRHSCTWKSQHLRCMSLYYSACRNQDLVDSLPWADTYLCQTILTHGIILSNLLWSLPTNSFFETSRVLRLYWVNAHKVSALSCWQGCMPCH